MKRTWISQIFRFVVFLIYCVGTHAQVMENPISLNPGIVTLETPSAPNVFVSVPVQVSVLSDQEGWSIECIAEPLVHQSGEHIIHLDRVFIQHSYSGGDYVPLNTSITLANGGVTGGYEIVNTLTLQVQVIRTDRVGTYHGLLRMNSDVLGEAILPVNLVIRRFMNFGLSVPKIHFHISGPPGRYRCKETINLNFDGNTDDWQIDATVDPIFQHSAHIGPECFFVEAGGGKGGNKGDNLRVKRMILRGRRRGHRGSVPLRFAFRFLRDLPAGDYSTLFHFFCPSWQGSNPVNLHAIIHVQPYSKVELDESEVTIDVSGPPGEYIGTPDIHLNIQSNTKNWEVLAEIVEDFESNQRKIPEDRLYIYSSCIPEKGFQPLSDKPVVLTGAHMKGCQDNYLRFKVKTTIHDIAGEYKGKIRCILKTLPD